MTITFPAEGGLQLGEDVIPDFDRCYQAHGRRIERFIL